VNAKVKFEGVGKSYGPVVALQEVSLEVSQGEFLTLLGPSGSGKTTLLMILAGLVEPSRGRVWIDGIDSTYTPSHQRGVGVVFQSYALFPHLTIYENIAFPLRMRRISEAEVRKRVAEVLEAVRLPGVEDRVPRELSGGQQQRIALARCIVYQPAIILMDEPLGALDKRLREQMQLEIKRLHRELGMTVLYVTHDQEEAMALSDRICLMNNGSIEQFGTPAELYFQPISVFSGDFLGESNLLQGQVREVSAGTVQVEIGPTSRIRAQAGAGAAAGAKVTCLVRPEAVQVVDGSGCDNEVEAVVQDVVVAGGVTRIYARMGDGTRILSVRLTSRHSQINRGTPIRLGWSAGDTIALS